MNALLIAGTDTGVGKTVLTVALTTYWQRYYTTDRLGILKPLLWDGKAIATKRQEQQNSLEKVWQQLEQLQQDHDFVLVESVGGLGAAVTRETTLADLAWDWRLPLVLVVPVIPGTIAHAVANVALANQARIHLKGIILNCVQPCHADELATWADVNLIQSLTHKPVLGCIPHLADLQDLNKLVQVASNLDLERLLPGTPGC